MRLYQDTAPTEVKIDNITYTLSWIDADSKEGKEYLGRHDPSNSEIRLNRALTCCSTRSFTPSFGRVASTTCGASTMQRSWSARSSQAR